MKDQNNRFETQGFEVLPSLLSPDECATLYPLLRADSKNPPYVWSKEFAATSRNYFEIGSHPALLDKLKTFFGGKGFVLWGASFIRRRPGQVHHWHTDLESSDLDGGFVSVWIGLKGTNQASALKLVPRSHRFGKSIQEFAQTAEDPREAIDDPRLLSFAREATDHAEILQPEVGDGDAIIFDGRLWHGSANTNAKADRYALLLQYARSDRTIKVPDWDHLDWPFQFQDELKAPCLRMSGDMATSPNLIAEPPPDLSQHESVLTSTILSLDPAEPTSEDEPFKYFPLLRGRTPNLMCLESHYSELQPGKSPHPPHAHVDEEVLVVLKGQATITYEDADGCLQTRPMAPGDGVYYPSFRRHTIQNHSDAPIRYLMFKWQNIARPVEEALKLQFFSQASASAEPPQENDGFVVEHKFSGATQNLDKLRLHASTLRPGAGYEPHADAHDVALILLEGEVETLDQRVSPDQLVWYAAGEPHGIRNVGEAEAKYLILEFHGNASGAGKAHFKSPAKDRNRMFKKRSPERVLRNLKALIGLK